MLATKILILLFFLINSNFKIISANAQVRDFDLKPPPESGYAEQNAPTKIEMDDNTSLQKNLSNLASGTEIPSSSFTGKRIRLKLDSYIDPKISMVGDYFKASILEDIYLPLSKPVLLIPKGTWVRGRISFVKKPTLFSMTADLAVKLDELTTPLAESIPINSSLDFEEGFLNEEGLLNPKNVSRRNSSDQELQDNFQNVTISSDLNGLEVVGKILEGSITALYYPTGNLTFYKGQELQLIVDKDISLVAN